MARVSWLLVIFQRYMERISHTARGFHDAQIVSGVFRLSERRAICHRRRRGFLDTHRAHKPANHSHIPVANNDGTTPQAGPQLQTSSSRAFMKQYTCIYLGSSHTPFLLRLFLICARSRQRDDASSSYPRLLRACTRFQDPFAH